MRKPDPRRALTMREEAILALFESFHDALPEDHRRRARIRLLKVLRARTTGRKPRLKARP